MNKILAFPASTTLTVGQALDSANGMRELLTDVLIAGYDADGDLYVRSSRMDRKDALWLAEQLKKYALDGA